MSEEPQSAEPQGEGAQSEPSVAPAGKGKRVLKLLLLLFLVLVLVGVLAIRYLYGHFLNPLAGPPPEASAVQEGGVQLEHCFKGLTFKRPVFLTSGDGTDRLYVVEQGGVIRSFEQREDVSETRVFLDLSKQISREGNEEGLLGLAFHPRFKTTREVFVYYSKRGLASSRVSRFRVDSEGAADPASEEALLEVTQPWRNHNGGMLAFGPDGFLYIGLGDGGAAGDPHGNGQNKGTLLGSILRIDVDTKTGDLAYGIPADNPFVKEEGARGELWAYGLRNPWRFSFDRKTGELWAGDVGQNAFEEIDLITKGGNYGWVVKEAFRRFRKDAEVPTGSLEPLAAYARSEGVSVTGGYVYRGSALPALQGTYLYADFASGNVWTLVRKKGATTQQEANPCAEGVEVKKILETKCTIASFGEDRAGELYVCSFDGKLYRFVAR